METIGLMPSSTDGPSGKRTGEKMANYVIEGGPSMQTTNALLVTDFRISWFDRHPPAGNEVAAIFGDTDSGDNDESGGMAGLLEPVVPDNKSNRSKYRRPMCAVQVRGKPGLRLMCGGDNCDGMVFELATNQERQQ